MKFKDIMVYIDDGDSNEERINAALSLASSHGARLTGVTMASIHPEHLKVVAIIKEVTVETKVVDYIK